MDEVGSFDAKNKLSELLGKAERGRKSSSPARRAGREARTARQE